ncbi:hypothetical protein [Engelhardtia mirabilis]|uniref:Uncharacterized protein n=1 Tax=Engelhardtia mirabilis TaxID=2528011 RepID=A0A518BJ34_9BACT|nr:hypothetical protein Pla133_20640 [Planctomycetes bacterium Pla133]QDV01314.1 hypothetical protein Pla86_20640 [Planctomycetes bacterium Pla86]
MSLGRLLVAWCLALVALLVIGGAGPQTPLAALSPTAVVALALIVVVGIPARETEGIRQHTGLAFALGLSALAPPLALAAAVDGARGEPAAARALAFAAAASIAALAWGARWSARGRAAHRVQSALHFGMVLGLPLLAAALAWAGRPGNHTVALSSWVGWSPAGFVFGMAGERGLPAPAELPWIPPTAVALFGALLVRGVAAGAGRSPRAATAVVGALVVCLGFGSQARAGEQRLFPARVELTGPLTSVRFDAGTAGSLALDIDLAPGEVRELVLPLPILGELARSLGPAPTVVASGGGGARLVGWVESDPLGRAWERLPRGLKSRAAPVPSGAPGGWSTAGLLVLVASLVIAIGALRRGGSLAWVAIPLQLAVAACLLLVPFGIRDPDPGRVEVQDLDLDAGVAARVFAARDRVDLGAAPWPERVETIPDGVPVEVRAALRGTNVEVEAVAAGAILVGRSASTLDRGSFAPRDGRSALEAGLGPGVVGHWRAADGTWQVPDGPPPAWAAAGLPPGVPGAVLRSADGRRWRRASGLEIGSILRAGQGL